MATADQIKALVESFGENDRHRFYKIALQVAAHEAKRGHVNVARELRDAIEEAQEKAHVVKPEGPVPIATPNGELEDVLTVSYPDIRVADMVLSQEVSETLRRLLRENTKRHQLQEHGLDPRRKLLLVGPPGTGKTMTARALAGELRQPLFIVRLDALMSRYMGETAAKLRLVFDAMEDQPGIYLFDEFDAIGSKRSRSDDVGEVRRVLNSFLQFIEADRTDSLIIAATNHPEILDYALFRRFDDVIRYQLPTESERAETMRHYLATFPTNELDWDEASEAASGLNHAELKRACEDAAKEMVLDGGNYISTSLLLGTISARKSQVSFD